MLFLLVLFGLVAYFFIIDWEVRVLFNAKTVPGVGVQTLRNWSSVHNNNLETLRVDSLQEVQQRLVVGHRTYVLNWSFTPLNDSTIKVKIDAIEPGSRILNKLLVPFTETGIEKDVEALALEYYRSLKEYLEGSRAQVVGFDHFNETNCLCAALATSLHEKAKGMMGVYNKMIYFLNQNGIDMVGMPLIDVKSWAHNRDHLDFDFCFPIADTVKIASNPEGFFSKTIPAQRALKAEYYGNYINSDRGWYHLIHYAQARGISVSPVPKEIFYTDPNLGADEMTWKTEIFLPVIGPNEMR